ncbi:zinc finger protein 658B-like [Melanaphis sacchari]|uniref:zinc finger protein 658B-like n=1 Tax=Melanaphis sacchari TaxID=742174 RepID=UPI000DC14F7A|nr:zinc finger protein 658B-like [Melanaphis sacchari]
MLIFNNLVPVNYFICNNCGRSYKYKRNLFAHKKYECGVQPKFSCDICFRKFAHRSHLRNHLITIHKKNNNYFAFPCPRCNRMYKHRASLNSHLKLECGVEPQFRCIACVCWKLNKQDFVIVDERFQCPNQCGRSYKALHGVRQHLRYECGVRPKFSCAVCTRIWRCVNGHCSRSYKNKFHLTYHLKYECGKQPLYKCDFCLRMFSRNSNMKKHMFTVHKYINEHKLVNSFCKPAEYCKSPILKGLCPFCPAKLTEINCLDEHVLDFHKPLLFAFEPANQLLLYPCPNNCGKKYKFKSSLSGHLKYECGKSPMYKCPYCKKRCTLKVSRFICTNGCGRSYKYKQGLGRHQKYECGVDPKFECPMCEKRFKQACNVKSHFVKFHKIIVID